MIRFIFSRSFISSLLLLLPFITFTFQTACHYFWSTSDLGDGKSIPPSRWLTFASMLLLPVLDQLRWHSFYDATMTTRLQLLSAIEAGDYKILGEILAIFIQGALTFYYN
jgi:hypothetical protein